MSRRRTPRSTLPDPRRDATSSRDGGFSFIELLAYMAIAALLILAAIPQFNSYRAVARDATTMSDVKNVAVALEGWQIEHPGSSFSSIAASWGNAGTHATALAALGVNLSAGTMLIIHDRSAWLPLSAEFSRPGVAFCVFAYNPDGKKYVSGGTGNRLVYHSGNGGLGKECDTR